MHVLQEVEHAAVAPRLSMAGVVAVLATLVRELRQARPNVLLDVLTRLEDRAVHVVEGHRGVLEKRKPYGGQERRKKTHCLSSSSLHVEVQVGPEEVAERPAPLGSLEGVRVSHSGHT